MKTKLTLLLIIFFYISAFNANAQTDTTKIIPNLNAADPGHWGFKIIYNDTLFFLYRNPGDKYNLAKYSNNTNTIVPNPNAADFGFQGNFIIFNNELYGQYITSTFKRVWAKYNGTGITLFNNPDAGTGLQQFPSVPVIFNGNLYSVYSNAANKYQLSKFDGTTTTLISNPLVTNLQVNQASPIIGYHNELYVVCDSANTKRPIAKVSGTSLTLIPNPDAGTGFGTANAILNDTLILQYSSTTGGRLVKFDGTNYYFVPNASASSIGFSNSHFVPFNNSLYFKNTLSANRTGLAKYDGSQVSFINNPDLTGAYGGAGGSFSSGTEMVVYNNALYAAYQTSSLKVRLCKYDGNAISIIDDLADTSEIASVKLVYNNTLCVTKYIGNINPAGKAKITLFNGSSFKPFVNATSTDNGPANDFIIYKGKLFFSYAKSFPFPPFPGTANLGYILSITSQQNVTCNGGNDGWAKVTPPPCGAGANTFLWSPGGQTTDSIGGLTAGSYSVRIICGTDTTNQAFTITEPAAVNAPTTSNQNFCFNATVANLTATGTNIKWYTTATGGTALVSTTPLTDGSKYYASQTIGGCESAVRAVDSVSVQIAATPVTSNQSFCGSPTVANLVATGTNIKWYLSPTGGFSLATSTALINGTKYYATQTVGTCESAIRAVDSVTVISTPQPTATNLVIYTGTKTLSQLNIAGTNVQFYANASGGTAIPTTTLVNDDSTYYVTQTQNGCESSRKQIVVNRIANDSIVVCGPATVAGLATTPQTGNTASWYTTATGGTALASTTGIPTGTITYYVEKFSTVVSNRVPVTVIVNPEANVLPTADTTVCNGSTIPAINFATTTTGSTVTYNWTNSNPTIGLAASGTGNIASFVATNPSTTPLAQTATIIVTPTITNAGITCEGVKDTFLIAVNPRIGVPVIANQVVCNGAPTTAFSFGGIRDRAFSITYNWTNNTPSIGLAASGTGNIPSVTAINNGNAPVTATITVTPNYTNNGVSCDGTPRTFTITVNPTATVDTVINQIACNGANTTAINFTSPTLGGSIVYDWTNSNNNIGLAASGTGDIASFTATNTGIAADTATIIVTPTFTNGGRTCSGTARTFKIIVNPTATVNAISNKVVCNGSAVAAVTPSSPNTGGTVTYAWVNNNTGIGLAASGTGTIPSFTATNTGTTALTATIIVTPTFTNGGVSCVGLDSSYTITVNPPPIFNTISNQVACNGSSTSVVPFSTSLTSGTSAFAWTNNNMALGLAASGSGSLPSFTATNNTTAPISGTISVVMTYTNAGLSCVSLPQTFTYTVNPTANVSLTNDAIVCNGATVPAANFTTTAIGGTVTYAWANDNTSIGLAANGTGNIASFTGVNTGTSPSTATIIVTPTFTNAGVSCVGVKDTFFVTVNPTVTVNTISNQVVCNGSAVTAINFGTSAIGGTTTYAWSNNTTSIGLAASGTGNIASFTATNTGTSPVTATIMVTPTFTNGGVSCVGTSTTFTITVNPTTTVNTIANQVVCNGTAVSAVSFGTTASGGTVVYNWSNNTTSIGLAASGTGNIATFNAVNTGATPVTANITVTPTFTNAGTSCTGVPKIFTITVNPTATVSPISNKVECNGSVVAAVTPSSPNTGGAITYTWVNNNTAIGLAASGTGTIPSFTATNTGTSPITATITVTPTFTNGSVSCVGTNLTYTITVNPPPIFNTVANQAACNGAVTSVVNFSTALTGGASVFAWTNSNTAIGLAASGTGSLPSFTATNNTTAPISGTISVVMTYTNAGLSCISLPQSFTYTVNPTATVNAVANQVVCNNSPTTAVNFTSPTSGGTIVYNWTNNTPSIGLAATGTGNIASFNAVNTTATPVIATITVTPSFSNAGVTCVGTPRTYTITVNPTATVNAISNQVVCNNSPTTAVSFGSPTTGGTIVYNWTNNTTSIGLAASGTGNIASFTATNTTTAPVTATITVTPSYTNGGVTCVGTPSTYTYTVNPTATVTPVTSQVICNGSPTTAVTFSSPTTGGIIVYNWTNNTPSIGLAATGSGNIASFNAVNTGTAPVIATITVTPSYTNGGVTCVGTPTTYTYTVNPTATVNVVANQVVCNLSPITAVAFSSPTSGGTTVYNWTNTTTSIGLAASGTGNIASFTATNTTTAPVTATITVTPSYTNAGVTCVGTPRTFTITVNPTATVNPVANQVLCNNFPTTAVTFTSPTTGGTIVYNWTNNTTSIGLAASGTGNIASFTATNTTQVPVVATITVTPSYTNGGVTCVGTPLTFTITVNPTPIVTLAPFAAICKNAAPITLTGGSPVAGPGTTGVYLVDNVAQTVFNPANYTPGLHTIVYVYTNQFGCVNSATQTILVHPIHTVEITVASNAGVSPYTAITVVASVSPAGNYTYVWRKNGVIVPGANADRINVLANDAGTYNVTVTAPTGCVVVSANAFTPSATLPNILFAFPNPNTGIFNVSYNNGAPNPIARTLMLYDSKGARVFSQSYSVNVPYGNMKVDISKYAKGLYYVVLNDSDGNKLASTAVEKL